MTRTCFAALLFATLGLTSVSAAAEDAPARLAIDSARELYAAGNWDTAREAYDDALNKAPAGSLLRAEATIELASLIWEQGEYVAADKKAREALKLAKKLKLDSAVGRLMLTLGHIEASRGQFGAAESTLKICVKSAQDQRDANFEALCRINLRFVRQLRGKSVGSEAGYRKDLNTLSKSGRSVLVGTSLAKSAELQEKAQDFAGGLATLRQAQAQFVVAGSIPAQSRNKLRIAQALQNLNQWGEAAKELDGLVLTFRNMKSRPSLVTTYALRGKQRAHDNDLKGALSDFNKARSTARSLGSPQLVANTELALCEHHAVHQDVKSARTHCSAASEGFSKIGLWTLAARSHVLLARLAQANEEYLQARTDYLEALRILSEEVAKSARDEREISVQEVNLCQVELRLKSNGAHRRCLDAGKALKRVKATDASYRGMVAATNYAIGVTTPGKQRDKAIAALRLASQEWIALGNGVQAAEANLRLGKLEADSAKSRVDAIATFGKGLKALGTPSNALGLELAVQLGIQKAQAELAVKRWADAEATLRRLVGWSSKTQDAYSTAWAYSALAQAMLKLKKRDDAIEALKEGRPFAKKSKDDDLLKSFDANLTKLGQ